MVFYQVLCIYFSCFSFLQICPSFTENIMGNFLHALKTHIKLLFLLCSCVYGWHFQMKNMSTRISAKGQKKNRTSLFKYFQSTHVTPFDPCCPSPFPIPLKFLHWNNESRRNKIRAPLLPKNTLPNILRRC